MASPVNAALCAIAAIAFWTLLGYALGRRLFPRALAIGAAPVLGWAVHSAAMLPLFELIGLSRAAVLGAGALCIFLCTVAIFYQRRNESGGDKAAAMPVWIYPAAGLLALVPAVAIVPKYGAEGVQLADPIFDHAKIAIIDAMTRLGVPPVNPVFGEFGAPGSLAYYYLWHFSAAQLASALGVSGWEADIGLTWFTACGSLLLMAGVAVWLGQRPAAAIWVIVLAAATSLRGASALFFGSHDLAPILAHPTGFAGWMFQAAWVPQHLMSASCVVAAMLLLAAYAQRPSFLLLLTLVLVVGAGFESSTYVGGVTFAIAAAAAAPILLLSIDPAQRLRFFAGLVIAAVLAACLAAPFLRDQFATVAARDGGSPIVLHPFEVLGGLFPPSLRRWLDLPAYWLILLPVEFPAAFLAGTPALIVLLRGIPSGPEKIATAMLAVLAAAGLVVSWLLVSTLGDNNDLGLRAVLPAAMVLIAAAAAAVTLRPRRVAIAAAALGGLVLSLPDLAAMIRSNVAGTPSAAAQVFAETPELWQAVRRHAAPDARVANNPLFLADLTPWPANISWALLSNRSSCFAGREMALAFAPLPPARREAINQQFIHVFEGRGTPEDVNDMARHYRCEVVIVTAQDGAWTNDPFASSADYHLAESRDGKWRIYVPVRLAGVKSRQTN